MQPAVCLFTDSVEPSGVGEHVLMLAAELRHQYRLSLVCPPAPACQPFVDRAEALGLDTLVLGIDGSQEAAERLGTWLRARRVSLFHAHAGIGWEGHAGVVAARVANVPAVVRTEHLPYLITNPRQQEEYRATLPLVDRVIGVSEGVGASFLKHGLPPSQLRIVRNGIRIRPVHLNRSDARARLGLDPGARMVLTLGRMAEQKGHCQLLDAIPSVVARVPEARFLWAGKGSLEAHLRAEVRRLGLAENVYFLGPRRDAPTLLAAADLLALPSRFEGLPLVALEAMAAGLPVVGTRVCGTSEAIEDGVTGRLVPVGDPRALAGAILEALERPARAAAWGAVGRRRAGQQFTARRMAEETDAIYRELLTETGAARRAEPALTAAS